MDYATTMIYVANLQDKIILNINIIFMKQGNDGYLNVAEAFRVKLFHY